ncbi:hypothetical protein GGF46_000530 [Coemansia sp. RSA 552]|nr:hypothetical protein GGF46_000530 [Coemansia sp. RSA 552]
MPGDVGGGQPAAKRVLERRHPAELGLSGAGAAVVHGSETHTSAVLRRNGANGQQQPHLQTREASANYRATKESGKRASLQYRVEQQMQPRLHLKGSAQGADGRFPLTTDNVDWHLRMLPPMKESKYDRILRYVHDQQQNVPAVADPVQQQQQHPQQQHNIDASMLLGGGLMHREYNESPPYGPIEQVPAQQQRNLFHSHLHHPLAHNSAHLAAYGAAAAGMAMAAPSRPSAMHPPAPPDHDYLHNQQYFPAGRSAPQPQQQWQHQPHHQQEQLANHTTTGLADAASVSKHRGGASADIHAGGDGEEDDDTPLAEINTGAGAGRSDGLDAIAPGVGLEKYMADSLDGPLPGPVSPAQGARMSMMSFQSNMANFSSEVNGAFSRSRSASNPLSVSVNDITSRATPVPHTPTTQQDPPVLRLSIHSGSVRPASLMSAQLGNRPSTDGIARTTGRPGLGDSDTDIVRMDTSGGGSTGVSPVLPNPAHVPAVGKEAGLTQSGDSVGVKSDRRVELPTGEADSPTAHNGQAVPDTHAASDDDSAPGVALRVVNQVISDESADEEDAYQLPALDLPSDDNCPLAECIGRATYDSDDDQPLVSLGRKLSEKQDQLALHIDTAGARVPGAGDVQGNSDDDDDDDDQPLSSLLFQPRTADEDLGSLPLPMPRHISDPDAVANMDEMVNESASPLRRSSGDRSASPHASLGVVRKKSLLSRTFKPEPDDDSKLDMGTRDPGTPSSSQGTRRHSYLRYSLPLSPQADVGMEGISKDAHNSFPRQAKRDAAGKVKGGDSVAGSEEQPGADGQPDGMGRPWLSNRQYSASTVSVGSRRHGQRGSTLGQQLTDELQRVREDIARTRLDNERAERRSWQVGDPPAMLRPWIHESTLSDTALVRGSLDPQDPAARAAALLTQAGDSDAVTHGSSPRIKSSWSYPSKQERPVSTQHHHRVSRWFGRAPEGSALHGLGADSESADAAIPTAQPSSSSLSARINNKFGKLKRTLKPSGSGSGGGAGC